MLRRRLMVGLTSAWMLTLLPAARAQAPGEAAPPKAGGASGQVHVRVTGFRSERGQVYVALWRSEKSFPGTPPKGSPTATLKIVKGVAETTFRNVAPGVFAISVFHDEDGDTELKKNFIGIPKEGIGISRDARGRFGPPAWEDAKLMLEPGELKQVKITMLYL